MFTTLETFYNDYSLKNNQQPNETVLNRPTMRLKRELREVKSIQDIILRNDIEEYSADKVYEIDEYVQSSTGIYYKSLVDANYNHELADANYWQLISIPSLASGEYSFLYNEFISDGIGRKFYPNFVINSTPAVFRNGVLLSPTYHYTYDQHMVELNETPDENDIIVLTSCYTLESTDNVLAKTEITAEENQYIFDTPFELTAPSVFVDGVLLPWTQFDYGRDYVDLKIPVKEGHVVTICNGAFTGIDAYTKREITNILEDYYLKTETYNQEEIDTIVSDAVTSIYNDDHIVKRDTIYTRSEIETYLQAYYATIEYVNEGLATKADIADTLAGYGIADAYTKNEILALLDDKLDVADFTRDNILYVLQEDGANINSGVNAAYLEGLSASNFMRQDVATQNAGGIDVWDTVEGNSCYYIDFESESLLIDTILYSRNVNKTNEEAYPFYHSGNTEGLIMVAEGDFKGTWYQHLYDFGFLDLTNYHFQVVVTNLGTGQQYDFIPKGYGVGFKDFQSFVMDNQSVNEGSYQYGFIEDNIVKMYSYVKYSDYEFQPIPGHYVLFAFHKTLTHKIYHNQGEEPKSFYQTKLLDTASFANLRNNASGYETPTPPDDVNDDNAFQWLMDGSRETETYESESRAIYEPAWTAYPATIYAAGNSTIYIKSLPVLTRVTITIDSGDGEMLERSLYTDEYGEAYVIVASVSPYYENIIIKIEGDNIVTSTYEIVLYASASDVITNLAFATVGDDNTPTIGLEGTAENYSTTITSGNNTSTDIALCLANFPDSFIGQTVTVNTSDSEVFGFTTQTFTVTQSTYTTLDGTVVDNYGMVALTEGHDLDWYYEHNGTYTVTVSSADVSQEYSVTFDVPAPTFGFDEDTKSYESFDNAPFGED